MEYFPQPIQTENVINGQSDKLKPHLCAFTLQRRYCTRELIEMQCTLVAIHPAACSPRHTPDPSPFQCMLALKLCGY